MLISNLNKDEMVGWHCRLNGHESEQTPRDGERQRSLVGYSPQGHRESDMTEHTHTHAYMNTKFLIQEKAEVRVVTVQGRAR